MLLRTVLLASILLATPSLADAVTYRGMVGDAPIILELSSDIVDPLPGTVGRFHYIGRTIDAPLHAVASGPGQIELIEELPCHSFSCDTQASSPAVSLLGPTWRLQTSDDGSTVNGERQVAGTHQQIALTRVSSRPFTPPADRLLTPEDLLPPSR